LKDDLFGCLGGDATKARRGYVFILFGFGVGGDDFELTGLVI